MVFAPWFDGEALPLSFARKEKIIQMWPDYHVLYFFSSQTHCFRQGSKVCAQQLLAMSVVLQTSLTRYTNKFNR
jgi:hypothetical protein